MSALRMCILQNIDYCNCTVNLAMGWKRVLMTVSYRADLFNTFQQLTKIIGPVPSTKVASAKTEA